MNKIQFNTIKYDLVDPVNRSASDFQATIVKGNNTLDAIISDAKSSEVIKVYDGNVVVATYEGYTMFKAASTYLNNDVDVVSIELLSADFQTQLNNMDSEITSLQSAQETQALAIEDLATSVSDLNDSQSIQDLAIEDLGEVVSELVEE